MTTRDAAQARSRPHSLIDETAKTHRPIMIAGSRGDAVWRSGWIAIERSSSRGRLHDRRASSKTRRTWSVRSI